MKIEISMGQTAQQIKVGIDMNEAEFIAIKKAFMWCDFSKMTPEEREYVSQVSRNFSRISFGS